MSPTSPSISRFGSKRRARAHMPFADHAPVKQQADARHARLAEFATQKPRAPAASRRSHAGTSKPSI